MPLSIKIVTIFPEFFDSPLSCGLMGRAVETGLLRVEFINPRDFAEDRHKSVDDRPYGGGPGMVMLPGPLDRALRSAGENGRRLLMSAQGRPLDQSVVLDMAREENLVVVCGRYEGIDARIQDKFALEPVCVGDFVLNGGEVAAMSLIEAVSRQIPGFMGKLDSAEEESFAGGLLEYPHYTRPEVFAGYKVPEILLSGDHGRIKNWRRSQSLKSTLLTRPDLLDDACLNQSDADELRTVPGRRVAANIYLALVHYPVLNKFGKVSITSLTNLDIHDIGRVSRTYGIGRYFLCTPVNDQQCLAKRLLGHWVAGSGAAGNPDRSEALSGIEVLDDLEAAKKRVVALSGMEPSVVATSARLGKNSVTPGYVRGLAHDRPVLLVLGTGHGLAPELMRGSDHILRPLRFLSDYNHMSVRSAASIILDRTLGDYN